MKVPLHDRIWTVLQTRTDLAHPLLSHHNPVREDETQPKGLGLGVRGVIKQNRSIRYPGVELEYFLRFLFK